MQRFQSQDMDDKIKCYRQAVFKLDHVKRKRDEDFACASLMANSVALTCKVHVFKPKCFLISLSLVHLCDQLSCVGTHNLSSPVCICFIAIAISMIHEPFHNPNLCRKITGQVVSHARSDCHANTCDAQSLAFQ